MLDISFSELVVCFLVALIVLGPERLPGAARAVGRWTGRARAYMRNFSQELEREAQLSELKKQVEETRRMLEDQARQANQTVHSIHQQAQGLGQNLEKNLSAPATGGDTPAAAAIAATPPGHESAATTPTAIPTAAPPPHD